MIWKTDFKLEDVNKIHRKTMIQHLGIEFTERGNDFLAGTMPVDEKTIQPYGILHGGASSVLAETLGSFASSMCLEDPINTKIVGIEINTSHLRPVSQGKVTGIAKPVKIGRKLHSWQIDIFDDEGKKISSSRLTTMILQ